MGPQREQRAMGAHDQSERSLGSTLDVLTLNDYVDFDFEADTLTSAQCTCSGRLKIVGVGGHT